MSIQHQSLFRAIASVYVTFYQDTCFCAMPQPVILFLKAHHHHHIFPVIIFKLSVRLKNSFSSPERRERRWCNRRDILRCLYSNAATWRSVTTAVHTTLVELIMQSYVYVQTSQHYFCFILYVRNIREGGTHRVVIIIIIITNSKLSEGVHHGH